MSDWPVEDVPDADDLYYRLHRSYVQRPGQIPPGAFTDRNGAMSTDWAKYSKPQESRARAKDPEANGIVRLEAGPVRHDAAQIVRHTPPPENRAHCDVIGKKDTETRVHLARIARWVLSVE